MVIMLKDNKIQLEKKKLSENQVLKQKPLWQPKTHKLQTKKFIVLSFNDNHNKKGKLWRSTST